MKGIYRIAIPLPNNPLKQLNSYFIKERNRGLLIDTGFNLPECKAALLEGIETLHADWPKIDFFITHFHADHSGLIGELAKRGSTIYCNEVDAKILQKTHNNKYWEQVQLFYIMHGYPQEELEKLINVLPSTMSKQETQFTYVKEGEILAFGDYLLICISTPGHTPGHMCLYEPKHKFIISGDHIIADITPNITARFDFHDALGWYLRSLNKIDLIDVHLVFPGHRQIINDCHERIRELQLHYKNRLEEVRVIMEQGPMSAYQAASLIHWDMPFSFWDQVPNQQKWFAVGEAIAHLENLAEQGIVQRIRSDEKLAYILV